MPISVCAQTPAIKVRCAVVLRSDEILLVPEVEIVPGVPAVVEHGHLRHEATDPAIVED